MDEQKVQEFLEENKGLMADLAGEPPKPVEITDQGIDQVIKEVEDEKVAKELKTEVVSVASEEEKTGQKVEVPKPEDLINKAISSFIGSMVYLEKAYIKLSARQKVRVLMSILDLPTEQSVVKLKTNEEKYCFALGQRIQSDRFIILQDAINKQIMAHKEKLAKEQEGKGSVTMLTEEQSEQIKQECICNEDCKCPELK